ncbi:RNA polymerase sigma-70 factor [Chitinophaga agrisoli]|uniref:RNA polymerase sigma-70 factor n=1 Tax=Chitinophaga agrisoli TaxID=2607653 RepID=A0A5B2VX66_9BACT|nr:RNA polymerase sigma-70 factor [Chitinophaga agrisoli]KAA2243200.1 RNA polymerase sigma-70 factor [Chitinophaga agrisoli]
MDIINKYNLFDEAANTALLKEGDMAAYEAIYNEFWPKLYGYVYNRLKNKEVAEEIVQEVFFSLWMKRATLELTHSLSAYLHTAVKYQLFNYLKADHVRRNYVSRAAVDKGALTDNSNEEHIAAADLKNTMEKEISRLPEKCQQVFRMSRQEHLSVHDIATSLNISRKTVENHLTKALRQLRMVLGHYICFLLILSASF